MMLDTTPVELEDPYSIEPANGKSTKVTHILRGCKLALSGHTFDINLMSTTLGSFDVVVGMDWLSENRAELLCREKRVHLPLPSGETLSISGEKSGAVAGITSFMKAQRCLRKKNDTAILLSSLKNRRKRRR
jgi:hypothetical protein